MLINSYYLNTGQIQNHQEIDFGIALQHFLDGIPTSSIPGIKDSPGTILLYITLCYPSVFILFIMILFFKKIPLFLFYFHGIYKVLELNSGDSVKDANCFLYEKNVSGALFADTSIGTFLDRYVGVIDIADMVLWSIEVLYFLIIYIL